MKILTMIHLALSLCALNAFAQDERTSLCGEVKSVHLVKAALAKKLERVNDVKIVSSAIEIKATDGKTYNVETSDQQILNFASGAIGRHDVGTCIVFSDADLLSINISANH